MKRPQRRKDAAPTTSSAPTKGAGTATPPLAGGEFCCLLPLATAYSLAIQVPDPLEERVLIDQPRRAQAVRRRLEYPDQRLSPRISSRLQEICLPRRKAFTHRFKSKGRNATGLLESSQSNAPGENADALLLSYHRIGNAGQLFEHHYFRTLPQFSHLTSPIQVPDPLEERVLIDQPPLAVAVRNCLESAVLAHLDQEAAAWRWDKDAMFCYKPLDPPAPPPRLMSPPPASSPQRSSTTAAQWRGSIRQKERSVLRYNRPCGCS